MIEKKKRNDNLIALPPDNYYNVALNRIAMHQLRLTLMKLLIRLNVYSTKLLIIILQIIKLLLSRETKINYCPRI